LRELALSPRGNEERKQCSLVNGETFNRMVSATGTTTSDGLANQHISPGNQRRAWQVRQAIVSDQPWFQQLLSLLFCYGTILVGLNHLLFPDVCLYYLDAAPPLENSLLFIPSCSVLPSMLARNFP
jgi:hypothetical protein